MSGASRSRYVQYMYSYPHKTAYLPVDRALVAQRLAGLAGTAAGLYIHLPFCQAKCGYCNLFSVANPEEGLVDRYLGAIRRQLEQINGTIPLHTVRFDSLVLGGGTPTLLELPQLEALLATVEQFTGTAPGSLFSATELSPGSASPEKLDYLVEKGFSRVSLGVQSFLPGELAALGRQEDPEEASRVLESLEGRFPVRNIDLIYGIPGQTRQSLLYSLEAALTHRPEELFLYPLYTRPGTPMAGVSPGDSHRAALYEAGRERLLGEGYHQLSMRRFVRDPVETGGDCGFGQCLSLGCGGRSYLGNLHVCEPYSVAPSRCRKSLERFVEKGDFLGGLHGYLLDKEEQQRRYVIKNLLHVRGLHSGEYHRHFGSDPQRDFPLLTALAEEGLTTQTGGIIRLTERGLAHSDRVGPLFISQAVSLRSSAFHEDSAL